MGNNNLYKIENTLRSIAKGTENEDSDIDIAIISSDFNAY